MPDGFNMVTAMETIHRHIHAVGCGALPSCWMTGDPSFFCRADGLFVPSLAVWFGAACRRPFGDGSWDGYLPPMPRGSMWGVRDHRTGDGWRRYISYGSHGVVSDVMEIMEAGVRRQCDFGISRYVPDEVEPLVSVHVRLSKRARYMELARLSVYASGEKLVFRLKLDALVYVQCLVECFRLAGVLPEDFSLGWRYLEYISRARRPRFSPDTHMVWRDRSSPERCVELFGVRDFGKAPLHRLCRMHGTGDVLRFGLRVVEGEALLEIGIDRRTSPGGAVCTMWNIL